MIKYESLIQTQNVLSKYINSETRDLPHNFFMNPIALYKAGFYYKEVNACLCVFKRKNMYGKIIVYLVGAPYHIHGNKLIEDKTLFEISEEYDVTLTQSEINYFNLSTSSEQPFWEFIYKSSDYPNDLPGKNWKMWRKSINQLDSTITKVDYHTSNVPLLTKNKVLKLMEEWKQERNNKGIANHSKWYVTEYTKSDNTLLIAYYMNSKLVAYDISILLGNTVYFLDGKISRDSNVNSNLDRAFHLTAIRKWKSILNKDFYVNTGLGDKPYTQDGHTYDLDQHKQLLRPHLRSTFYKIRKGNLKHA